MCTCSAHTVVDLPENGKKTSKGSKSKRAAAAEVEPVVVKAPEEPKKAAVSLALVDDELDIQQVSLFKYVQQPS